VFDHLVESGGLDQPPKKLLEQMIAGGVTADAFGRKLTREVIASYKQQSKKKKKEEKKP